MSDVTPGTRTTLREQLGTRAGPKHELATLLSLAVIFGALDVVISVNSQPTTGWAGPRADLVLQLLVDVSVLGLRRFPKTVTGIALAVAFVTVLADGLAPGLLSPENPASPLILPRVTSVIVIFLVRLESPRVAFPLIGALAIIGSEPWAPSWTITPVGLLSTIGPAAVVLYLDARKQLLQELRDRAERAERETHLLAEQARFEERRRLAAEMHDVLTHGLSLMVLHAGALGISSKEPDVRKAAEEIRARGAMALDELRDLVGVLNTTSADISERMTGPSPRLGSAGAPKEPPPPPDPATLVAESVAAGIPVELDVEGERSQMSPTIARTVHRIVQEALTNARKHAAGAEIRVELRYRPDGVGIRVVNTPPRRQPDEVLAGSGSGLGLSSLRHRVELVGGTLQAGPTPDGGFRIAADLPAYVPTTETRQKSAHR
ncbi:histidine kinase [Amycolatopsis mongoliensis]|uniref:histidine kinase n=1 Tax=Amycolatopsis mongoliensis TaxID=715475 RepID=A0A9Y2JNI5_9PSEU|nr:histidine kinase [Amycolatopsis sp. 4-36]WIY01886.1 histidine kinase [Amycolatopsis sp. 4-36]